jgi:FG-GAP-like repeat
VTPSIPAASAAASKPRRSTLRWLSRPPVPKGRFKVRNYPTGKSPALVIADVDGDGELDLVTANEDADSVSVLLNRGDGSFRSKVDFGAGKSPDALALADLNGDGRQDVVTAYFGGETYEAVGFGRISVLIGKPAA